MYVVFVLAVSTLYKLLEPVNKDHAALMVVLVLPRNLVSGGRYAGQAEGQRTAPGALRPAEELG